MAPMFRRQNKVLHCLYLWSSEDILKTTVGFFVNCTYPQAALAPPTASSMVGLGIQRLQSAFVTISKINSTFL
jgi:hypothetical protein